jgi:hypothetical protein
LIKLLPIGWEIFFYDLNFLSFFSKEIAKKCKIVRIFLSDLLFFVKNTSKAIIFFEKYLVCS